MRACITVCDHASGTTYPWTAPNAFETLREAPLLLGLKDNADYVQATWTSGAPTDTTTVAFFAWTTDQQATAYRLQLAPEQAGGVADFTQPWLETELTTWTSQPALEDWLDNPSMFYQALVGDPARSDAAGYLVESVPMGTRMQWRVRAEGPGWASAWSQPKGFETEPAVVSRHYFVKDHLGSPRAVVDETGQVVEYRDHYPFGLEMPGRTYASGVESRENFTGHERDTETGLVYAGARYLDPVTGTWGSLDPLAEKYPGWSAYNYTLNNPARLTDPDGKSPVDTLIYYQKSDTYYYTPEGSDYVAFIDNRGDITELPPAKILDMSLTNTTGSASISDAERKSGVPTGTVATGHGPAPGADAFTLTGGDITSLEAKAVRRDKTVRIDIKAVYPGRRGSKAEHTQISKPVTSGESAGGGVLSLLNFSAIHNSTEYTSVSKNGSRYQAYYKAGASGRYERISGPQFLGLIANDRAGARSTFNHLHGLRLLK